MYPLACGCTRIFNSTVDFRSYKTFDGSKLYISRESEGTYKLFLPRAWFSNSYYIYCSLTGVLYDSTKSGPIKASIDKIAIEEYTISDTQTETM